MRVLIVAIGTYGDVLPFIGLAAELDRRGHEVTLSCAETFAPAARRAGVDVEPLTTAAEYSALFEHPQFWRPFLGARRLFKNLHSFLKPTHDFVVRHHREGDTLVIASALAIGAKVAHETLGVPVVSVHLTPIMFVSRDAPPRTPFLPMPRWMPAAMKLKLQTGLYTAFIAPLIKPGLNAFRASLGLRPKRKIRSWWHSSQRMLLLFPHWFAPRQADWPAQSVQLDFPRADMFGAATARLDPALDAFLSAGEPPVAITFGSARLRTASLYRAAVEACAKTGRRCLVLSHQTIDPPKGLEGRAFFSTYAPLGQVLPRCSALIHHGGVGTVSQAFAAGAPQIVVPMAFDQFDHASRIRRLGCGTSVPRALFTARRAAQALDALLASDAVASACRSVAERTSRSDVIAEACDRIEAEFGRARSVVYPPCEAAE
ncbi:glycosyltransferase [Chenggangzhangella methanolivorans]|uniref:Glycosyltransferase n=1 Tax=Chenggangzhangella methanolivorans TaxID=1437009 RepID=A0A9E6R9R6_9HYPH|nr:nucleotide disphospho-sugar-binding domain-containing protein [Chenggangzhangella methanolivorans]QZO00400.1 glycosyltransferase [Chenggangzhangella methanolivorans]